MTTTHQLIAKQTVGSAGASSITFSNIPQTYTDLKIVMSVRATRSGTDISTTAGITFNGNNNANYRDLMVEGGYGSTRSAMGTGQTYIGRNDIPSDNATAYSFSNNELYIPNYAGTGTKVVGIESFAEYNGSANYMYIAGGLWSLTEPITSITLSSLYTSTFDAYSTFYLYGISNSTTTQSTSVPYASGGDVIASDGEYWYHAFKQSGTFALSKNVTADVLVIAGGGGGGGMQSGGGGGGGGAGGVCYQSQRTLAVGSFAVTVGASGAGGSQDQGTNGSNSVFDTITAIGGGGGGIYSDPTAKGGKDGGSGGGGGGYRTALSILGGNSNQYDSNNAIGFGYSGGNGLYDYSSTGGGGGAGSRGVDGTSSVAGNGGAGLNTWSSWATATSTGVSGYYAGGGGGASRTDLVPTAGTGGSGGGGNGGGNAHGSNAVANTGSGGGGGGNNGTTTIGGNGGSGLVIIRYPK